MGIPASRAFGAHRRNPYYPDHIQNGFVQAIRIVRVPFVDACDSRIETDAFRMVPEAATRGLLVARGLAVSLLIGVFDAHEIACAYQIGFLPELCGLLP